MSSYYPIKARENECTLLCGSPGEIAHEGNHGHKHPICYACFEQIIENNMKKCPSCREDLSGRLVRSLHYDAAMGCLLSIKGIFCAVFIAGIYIEPVITPYLPNILPNYLSKFSDKILESTSEKIIKFIKTPQGSLGLASASAGLFCSSVALTLGLPIRYYIHGELLPVENCLNLIIVPIAIGVIANIAYQRNYFKTANLFVCFSDHN